MTLGYEFAKLIEIMEQRLIFSRAIGTVSEQTC